LPLVFVLFWGSNSDVLAFIIPESCSQKQYKPINEPGRVAESPLEKVVIVRLLFEHR